MTSGDIWVTSNDPKNTNKQSTSKWTLHIPDENNKRNIQRYSFIDQQAIHYPCLPQVL